MRRPHFPAARATCLLPEHSSSPAPFPARFLLSALAVRASRACARTSGSALDFAQHFRFSHAAARTHFARFPAQTMRVVAAYMLAVLSGNDNPDASAIKAILSSVGISADDAEVDRVISNLSGKNLDEVIAQGEEKLVAVPTGGGGGGSGAAAGGDAGAAEEEVEEEEPEESSSSSDAVSLPHPLRTARRAGAGCALCALPCPAAPFPARTHTHSLSLSSTFSTRTGHGPWSVRLSRIASRAGTPEMCFCCFSTPEPSPRACGKRSCGDER